MEESSHSSHIPSVVPKTGKEMEAHPIFRTVVTRVKDDSYGVLYIKYFTFLMQQMTIEIDEDFIFALLDFTKVPGASWNEGEGGKASAREPRHPGAEAGTVRSGHLLRAVAIATNAVRSVVRTH